MRYKILDSELENWLFINYPKYDNAYLAAELTKKVLREKKRTLTRLERDVGHCTNPKTRKKVECMIRHWKNVTVISVDYVKHKASELKCPPKLLSLISEQNRLKANKSNLKQWKSKAEYVEKPMEWFRGFEVHIIKYVLFNSHNEMDTMSSLLSKWNSSEGHEKGLFLSARFDRKNLIARIESLIDRSL